MMMLRHARAASSMQGVVSDVLSKPFDCPLSTAFPICPASPACLFRPRFLSSMSHILPYGSRGDVKSDDSHVRACTCIHPCTCFGTYLSIIRLWRLECHPTPSSHAMPYTDCLSWPLLSSLQRNRVGPVWNPSYITLLYQSLGSALIRCRHRHLG
jgi:hypothetical protein